MENFVQLRIRRCPFVINVVPKFAGRLCGLPLIPFAAQGDRCSFPARFGSILLLALLAPAALSQPNSESARSAVVECPLEPTEGWIPIEKTLLYALYDSGTWHFNRAEVENVSVQAFNDYPVCFYYGVASSKLRTGALAITAERHFQSNATPLVLLSRGKGFKSEQLDDLPSRKGSVGVDVYRDFHSNCQPDPDLRRAFHGRWSESDSSHTASPCTRRRSLTFDWARPEDAIARRAYLIRYTTHRDGSWLPFEVHTAGEPSQLLELKLTLWDLGAVPNEASLIRTLRPRNPSGVQ